MKGRIGTNYPKGYWEQFKDDIVYLYTNKLMSTYQLADKYNTTHTTIVQYLKQWNVYDKTTAYNKKNKFKDCGDFYIGYTRNDNYEFYIDKKYYDLIWGYCWYKHKDGYLRTCIGKKENGGNIYKLMHVMIMEAEGHSFSDDLLLHPKLLHRGEIFPQSHPALLWNEFHVFWVHTQYYRKYSLEKDLASERPCRLFS